MRVVANNGAGHAFRPRLTRQRCWSVQYQLAVAGALRDRVPEEDAATTTTVSPSMGAGLAGGHSLQCRFGSW